MTIRKWNEKNTKKMGPLRLIWSDGSDLLCNKISIWLVFAFFYDFGLNYLFITFIHLSYSAFKMAFMASNIKDKTSSFIKSHHSIASLLWVHCASFNTINCITLTVNEKWKRVKLKKKKSVKKFCSAFIHLAGENDALFEFHKWMQCES